MGYRGYVTTDRAGHLVVPEELRTRYRLDRSGLPFEVVERDDGVLELRPIEIDPEQAWFWTPEWLAGEQKVDDEITAGRTHGPMTEVALFSYLDQLAAEADTDEQAGRAA